MLAIANQTLVSLHSRPSAASGLVDEILYGMCVEILSTVNSKDVEDYTQWCLVRTHYHYEGYCRRDELVTVKPNGNPSDNHNPIPYLVDFSKKQTYADYFTYDFSTKNLKVVMHPYIDILNEPRIQGTCLQSITRGGRICVLEEVFEKDGWVKVALADGRIGYTKEHFLGEYYTKPFTDQEDIFRLRLVEMAKLYMGTQYRWGGKSPLGIDCSGLTSISYLLCGIIIYRDAAIKEGFPIHKIPFAQKNLGDLLYFPGHIAMYIGYDLYIHSTAKSGSDGVVINSLNPDHALYRGDLVKSLQYVGSVFP